MPMATDPSSISARAGPTQTIRIAPTTVIRRSRENVRGRVIPSPDGLAIDIVANPSPPWPSPEKLGPFATKIEQFIARAIAVIVATFVEWIEAVCRNECSARAARAIARAAAGTRPTGLQG